MITAKSTLIRVFALITLFFALALPAAARAQNIRMGGQSGGGGGAGGNYISQTYVDTTILRAFYVINAASAGGFSATADRQAHAVDQAERILSDLRRRAKGDPNERYALMKIQEVEAQIFLEKEEMRQIRAQRNQLVANQLVIQYNGEVAKPRPDFAVMRGLFLRMSEVDVRQANRLADSYNKRHRGIAHEAQNSLEKALNAKNYDLAKRELDYLHKNRNFLMVPSSYLERQRERLGSLSGAQSDLPLAMAALEAGEQAYRDFKLAESRQSLTMAQNRIREFRGQLPEKDANALTARVGLAIRALDNREDSLVRVALSVLDLQGPDAAVEYFQGVLQRRMNMSQERAAIVDHAILSARPDFAIKLDSKIKMVEVSDQSSGESFSLIQDQARLRAQARADSTRVIRDRATNITENIYTLIKQKNSKDATRLFNREKKFLNSVLDKRDFTRLELTVFQSSGSDPQLDKNRKRAEDQMAQIYLLIEANRTKEAAKRFQKQRKPLQRHLDSETFQMLEITVAQSAGTK